MKLFTEIDRRIQTVFDACVHWFMVTFGVTKGFVRYAFWTTQVVLHGGESFLRAAKHEYGWAAFTLFIAASLLWAQRNDAGLDMAAERAGAMSAVDETRVPFVKGIFAGLLLITAPLALLEPSLRIYVQEAALVMWLALEYLRGTNPRPPEKRQHVHAPQTAEC